MTRGDRAEALFMEGYNCAQATALAFADLTGLEEKTLAKMISGFGGGFCRAREMCGAASGMMLILSMLEGYSDAEDLEGKKVLYKKGQKLLTAFADKNGKGSYICADILGKPRGIEPPVPETRDAVYYAHRPCAAIVRAAAEVLSEHLGE